MEKLLSFWPLPCLRSIIFNAAVVQPWSNPDDESGIHFHIPQLRLPGLIFKGGWFVTDQLEELGGNKIKCIKM